MLEKQVKVISDYAKEINEEFNLESETKAKKILDSFIQRIVSDVNSGITARINKLGSFKKVTRAARSERTGRNPQTGEALTIAAQPEKQVIAFKRSK